MKNQLEERVEALENIVIDLIDVIAKGGTMGAVSVPDTDVLANTLRGIGQQLVNLYPSTNIHQVMPTGTLGSDVREILGRLKSSQETMVDRKAGIE